jgi:hypothetical protein
LLTILAENQILGIRERDQEAPFAQPVGNSGRQNEGQFLLQRKIDRNDSNCCSVEHRYGGFSCARGRKP